MARNRAEQRGSAYIGIFHYATWKILFLQMTEIGLERRRSVLRDAVDKDDNRRIEFVRLS